MACNGVYSDGGKVGGATSITHSLIPLNGRWYTVDVV
jgi:hypothetical protein